MNHDWKWDLIPAALGAAFLALVAGAVWSETPKQYIYDYQTLITGLIAIFAAWWTVRHTREQLAQQRAEFDHQQQVEKDRRVRADTSARAALPVVLSDLLGYAQDCLRLLVVIRERSPSEGVHGIIINGTDTNKLPAIPPATVPTILSAIVSVDDDMARRMHAMIVNLQIQNSRIRGTISLNEADRRIFTTTHNLDHYIVDAADLYARADKLLAMARGEYPIKEYEPAITDINRATTLCGLVDQLPSVTAIIQRRYGDPAALVPSDDR